MARQYSTRTFKSGNSLAPRLPKAPGVRGGLEMTVREEDGRLTPIPVDASRRKIEGDWIGSISRLRPPTREEREFDGRHLDWDGTKLDGGDG